MNENTAVICEKIRKAFTCRHPSFPVLVVEAPDDRLILCARVFAVTADKVCEVEDTIQQLEHDLIPDGEYLLLPMIKSLEVTQQYYPEFMPEPTAAQAFVEQFLRVTTQEASGWQTAARRKTCAGDWPRQAQQVFNFGNWPRQAQFGRTVGEQLRPALTYDNRMSINTDLAYAA